MELNYCDNEKFEFFAIVLSPGSPATVVEGNYLKQEGDMLYVFHRVSSQIERYYHPYNSYSSGHTYTETIYDDTLVGIYRNFVSIEPIFKGEVNDSN